MADHQTPSMPPLPKPSLWVGSDITPLSRRGSGRVFRHFEDVPPSDGTTVGLYTAAEAQAVADERVREALAGVLDALEAGHDALAAAATDYHTTMAGYRPHVHKAMDAEVASVKAVLERVRASLAELKGKP